MVEEVYKRTSSTRPPSLYQIRQQKKKALQSYKHIRTIKTKAEQEAEAAKADAEEKLSKFITSSWDHGK